MWYGGKTQNVPNVPQKGRYELKVRKYAQKVRMVTNGMKIMIGFPCMDKIDTLFYGSVLGLRRTNDDIHFNIKKGSMIYDARNEMAVDAITTEADRVLMIDSDMVFKPDLLQRLNQRMDEGCEMVCGLFFQRVIPTKPVIYKQLQPPTTDEMGNKTANIITYTDYPKDSLFEVEGCGFGAVMMTKELIKDVWDYYGQPPFSPLEWCGEDMAFCYKVRQMGRKIWCDSSIKVGHLGQVEFGEETWIAQNAQKTFKNE